MNPWGSNPSSKRRDKLFIIAEILEIAKEGTLKTQIMYRANLSFTQLNGYLGFMIKINLLEKAATNAKDVYRTTEKGLDFLQRYREISELMKTDDDPICRNNVKVPPPHLLKRT
jgi:predicted transcriptional regulator